MKHKIKGVNAERNLVHLFFANGWSAVRVAGSGSSRYPSPDILASNNKRLLAIECKTSRKKSLYIRKEEIQQLAEFCKAFGSETWLAVKFNKGDWKFLKKTDLKETEKNFCISIREAESRGAGFEELIKMTESFK